MTYLSWVAAWPMDPIQALYDIIPQDIFNFKENASPEEQSQHLIDQCFPGATGMQLQSMNGELAEASIPYAKKNRALHGFMHGGCYFTVGDTLTAIMCTFHLDSTDQRMLTVDASIKYVRPIRTETVLARAKLISHAGNRLNFVCDFLNEAGKLAARAKYKYALTQPVSAER